MYVYKRVPPEITPIDKTSRATSNSSDFAMITFVRFIYPLLIFYCWLNGRKEVAAISFFFSPTLCVTGVEAWLAVVTSLAIYAQTDDPGWHVPAPNNPLARKRKRNRQSSGRAATQQKKEGDIAASAQQSCRSIHQKMETNFLSVVVSPVDVIVLLWLPLHLLVALRLLLFLLLFLTGFFMPFLFYCCSIFYLAFLLIFCCLTLVAIQWSENGAACT